jgi:hypothetical protein
VESIRKDRGIVSVVGLRGLQGKRIDFAEGSNEVDTVKMDLYFRIEKTFPMVECVVRVVEDSKA